MATSLPELVAFRALQGLGGGMLVPVGMTMITRAFPPAERIKANQVLIVPTLLAPALGPVIGGVLVDGLSWRWIFYINLPVGVAALVVGALFLPPGPSTRRAASTCPGSCSPATGFPLFMYALSTGSTSGWGVAAVLGTGLPGLVLLALFVARRAARGRALLRLRIYADRLFRVDQPAAHRRRRRVHGHAVPGAAAAAERPRLLRRSTRACPRSPRRSAA